ncbi:phosphatase PAP2 family protein [Streptomyces sp. RerS4]|uniref:phosphatase PAP2 family protein n=1 Tax=Streptomyces sp. RerS4 TaxID=2942449 RepID=UPI00201BA554|nr:phosphatase PAP2 family protein [Streptomyces sp. RerS4]UQX04634.1 phosphatase PAP2 family protein [Streptomyces sp. RerS4]
MAAWDSDWARQLLPPVEEAAEHTKLWWAAAVIMAANGVAKQLVERRRPPEEWIPHDDVEDRPDSSSFPSGHTAAAVAFTATVASCRPWAGAACAVPTVLVALERLHSGAHYPSDVAAGAASAWPRPPSSGRHPASWSAAWDDHHPQAGDRFLEG